MTVEAYDDKGQRFRLPTVLGRGGEGAVYDVIGRRHVAAKILYEPRRTRAKYDKIKAMVAGPPVGAYDEIRGAPVLTWPRALLFSSPTHRNASTFLGYTMVRVQPGEFVAFYKVTSSTRRQKLPGTPITFDRLVRLGIRLCHVVRTLHDFGYAVGDLNDRNVLVSRRFTPLFMDNDSFQVPKPGGGHFPSIVGDQMYWAPELLDVDFAGYRGSRVLGDRFALGVLLFQLLMNGLRPYQARGSKVDGLETLAEKTRAGHYPWAKPRAGVLEPPAGAPDYRALPATVRRAFEKCFVEGHGRPKKRPSPHDWYDVLFKVNEAGYRTCSRAAEHVYPKESRSCPWCKDPNDPFTDPKAPRSQPPRTRAPRRKTPAAHQTTLLGTGSSRTVVRPKTYTGRTKPPQRPLPPPTASRSQTTIQKQEEEEEEAAAEEPMAPLAERWYARFAWAALLVAAYASPLAVFSLVPLGPEKMGVMTVSAVVLLVALGLRLTWNRVPDDKRPAVAGFWTLAASAVVATLVLIQWWNWLEYATGATCLLLGFLAFARLERDSGPRFRPHTWGLAHGAIGLVAAYAPVLALGVGYVL